MDFVNNELDIGNQYAKAISCIPQVTLREPNLSGEGVIVAVLDSGIDYQLPEFRDEGGRTRIIGIWDQTAREDEARGFLPPEGFREGVLFTREQINDALQEGGDKLLPTRDTSGHGTAVTAVAAGSISGVAVKSDILVVKLGTPQADSFPRTTQLMRGITYAVGLGVTLNRPVAINISFGNTYGDHRGESLLERFIDNASEIGKSVIVIGSGNEGSSNGHTAGITFERKTVELIVASYETGLSVQYWKYFNDQFALRIISPGGSELLLTLTSMLTVRRTLEQTQLLCYVGEPLPYSVAQEIFIDMIPDTGVSYINAGVWRFELIPKTVVTGEYRFYLPSYAIRNAGTGFLLPTPEVTLTIPSTSNRAITVAAYNQTLRSYADFSGRGYVYRYLEGISRGRDIPFGTAFAKPDLAAPGVDITVPVPGGGYEQVSGTSFATPFVTGSAALMMEYGIIRKNDIYMYGQKLKSFLTKGAVKLPGIDVWPNEQLGWGALCLRDSIILEG